MTKEGSDMVLFGTNLKNMLAPNVFEASQRTRAMKGVDVKMDFHGTGSGFLSSVVNNQIQICSKKLLLV